MRLVGMALGGALGLLGVVLLAVGLVALGSTDPGLAGPVAVSLAAFLVTSWTVLPLVAFGADETLDPVRFALLPANARALRPGLLASAMVGVPGPLTVAAALTTVLLWLPVSALAALAAVVAAALLVLTCVLASRALSAGLSRVLSSRRFRDVGAVLLAVAATTLGLTTNVISQHVGGSSQGAQESARSVGTVLSWTPFGWAAAIPADVADGAWGPAAVRFVLAAALVALLWWGWGRLLDHRLTSAVDAGDAQIRVGTRLDRMLGSSARAAVTARAMRYWRRDPRYLASLVSMAVLPVLIALSGGVGGGGPLLAAPIIMALLAGPSVTSDLAYDNSALWVHIVTGLPGRADRAGRAVSQLLVLGPLALLALVAVVVISGRWDIAVGLGAVVVTMVILGTAIGLVAGAIHPGQAPPPGASPFAKGAGGGFVAIVIFFGGALATGGLSAPVWVTLLLTQAPAAQAACLVLGIGYALSVLGLAVRWSGHRLDQRWPELLATVRS